MDYMEELMRKYSEKQEILKDFSEGFRHTGKLTISGLTEVYSAVGYMIAYLEIFNGLYTAMGNRLEPEAIEDLKSLKKFLRDTSATIELSANSQGD